MFASRSGEREEKLRADEHNQSVYMQENVPIDAIVLYD